MATLVRQDLTVQAGEVRTYAQNTGYAITAGLLIGRYEALVGETYFEPTVINYGEMHLDDAGFGTGQLLYFTSSLSWNYGVTKNYGLMSAVVPAASSIRVLFGPGWSPDVYNYGTIVAEAQNDSIGYETWDGGALFLNGPAAIVRARGAERALALFFPNGGKVTNDGQLLAHVTGGGHPAVPDMATAVQFGWGGFFSESSVVNSGLIQATGTDPAQLVEAITIRGETRFSIVNSGTIRGTNAIAQYSSGTTGSVSIENRGLIDGRVILGLGNDTFVNTNQVTGSVDLGGGNDVYDGAAGTVTGPIRGGAGNDRITAGSGDQQLLGDDGDDSLEGGAGNDALDGGAGADTAYYATAAAGVTVSLAATGYQATGGAGSDSLTAIENLSGSHYGDILTGDGSANRIAGGGGGDRLAGGGGADRLEGGAGGDVFVFGAVSDSTAAAQDRIVDFEPGVDKIDLLGLGAISLSWQSVVDGTGTYTLVTAVAAAGTLVVRVDTAQALSRSDFVAVGSPTEGDDELFGTDGVDAIDGLGGNDRLDGLLGADRLSGGSGDDRLQGGDGADELRSGTGTDLLEGGADNDVLYFGGAFSAGDRADGGSGRDAMVLQGNYTLTLGAAQLIGIESISLQSGANSNFGDTANAFYDFSLTLADGNVAAGQQLIVNAQSLRAGEDFTFNGSAEHDGKFLVYGGHGVDVLKGGDGVDVFFFEGQRWGASDRVDGGAGRDAVVISAGDGLTRIEFGATSLTNIESISVNNHFATDPSQHPSYELVLHNGNVAPGGSLIVNGSSLPAGQVLKVDGRGVHDGGLLLLGGGGHDTLTGGDRADLFIGGAGADSFTGGAGADSFRYAAATDSTAGAPDLIGDFLPGADRIDLSRIDANILAGGDQAFRWIGANAFSGGGAASAGELRTYQSGGYQWVAGDTNGDGTADLVIALTTQNAAALGQGDFLF